MTMPEDSQYPGRHDPNRTICLSSLASALWSQFEQLRRYNELEEAIALHPQAVELISASHPDRPLFLMNQAFTLLNLSSQVRSKSLTRPLHCIDKQTSYSPEPIYVDHYPCFGSINTIYTVESQGGLGGSHFFSPKSTEVATCISS